MRSESACARVAWRGLCAYVCGCVRPRMSAYRSRRMVVTNVPLTFMPIKNSDLHQVDLLHFPAGRTHTNASVTPPRIFFEKPPLNALSTCLMEPPPAPAAPAAAPVFKKRERNKNVRPRGGGAASSSADAGPEPEGSAVIRVAKAAKANPLVQGTASARKAAAAVDLLAVGVQPSDARISTYDNKATASSEQDVPRDRDAQALYETAQKQWEDGGDRTADGAAVYRGQKAYRQYTNKAEDFTSQVMSGAGPARAPVHYRATAVMDYKPDICKDFRDTGYCGYGDACKFLHDRSDYKSGWQLERDWEESQKKKASRPPSLPTLRHAAALPPHGPRDAARDPRPCPLSRHAHGERWLRGVCTASPFEQAHDEALVAMGEAEAAPAADDGLCARSLARPRAGTTHPRSAASGPPPCSPRPDSRVPGPLRASSAASRGTRARAPS